MLNNEDKSTYTYNWKIVRKAGLVDITNDVVKTYYNTDITKVHMDNNVLEPNNYYNLTFYVQGNDAYYKGMLASQFNEIYIGIPPKNGKCQVTPLSGIAVVQQFTIKTPGWVDSTGISAYNFYYSFDGGETYLPISSGMSSTTEYYFPNIY